MKNPPVAVSPNEAESIGSDWVVGKILSEPAITDVSSMSAAVSIYFDPGQGHTRHQHGDADRSPASFKVLAPGVVPARRDPPEVA